MGLYKENIRKQSAFFHGCFWVQRSLDDLTNEKTTKLPTTYFSGSPCLGEMIQFDEHIFSIGLKPPTSFVDASDIYLQHHLCFWNLSVKQIAKSWDKHGYHITQLVWIPPDFQKRHQLYTPRAPKTMKSKGFGHLKNALKMYVLGGQWRILLIKYLLPLRPL